MKRRHFLKTAAVAAVAAPNIPAVIARATEPALPLNLDEIIDRIYRIELNREFARIRECYFNRYGVWYSAEELMRRDTA